MDGDTLILVGGMTVRLIGVDCPETVHPNKPVEPWGPEATAFARAMLEGRQVRLEFDRERLDRYDRHLAYVWLGESLLNEELIRAGLGRAEPQFRYSPAMKARFRRAQQEAQSARRGLWSGPSPANL